MSKNKILALVLSVMMIVSLVPTVMAAGLGISTPCKHENTEVIYELPATCGSNGMILTKCTACRQSFHTDVPATGEHIYEDGYCVNCGEKSPFSTAPVEPAHEGCLKPESCDGSILMEIVRNEPDCINNGKKETVYACGKFVVELLPATGEHSYEDGICSVCGAEDPDYIPEPAHEGCLKPKTCDGSVLLVTVKKEATCTEDGVKEVVYACGKFVIENIPAAGKHIYEDGYCVNCGEKSPFSTAPVEPAHEGCLKPESYDGSVLLVTVKKEATCTEDGVQEVVYACGKFVIENIPAAGKHIYEDGYCVNCGEKSPFSTAPVEPAHEGCLKPESCDGSVLLVTVKKEATCTEDGVQEVVYACGKFVIENISAAGKHTYEDGYCINCGEKSPFSTACKHENTRFDIIEANCAEEGVSKVICKDCDAVVSEEILPKTENHYFNNGICRRCGIEEPACDHDYVVVKELAPTCVEAGYVWTECSICGAEKNYETTIDADAHDYVIVKELPASCTEAGYVWTECALCGAEKNYETGSAAGHNAVEDAAVAPTCTETGLTAGSHCADCGIVLVAQEIVEATGHTAAEDAAVAPTCTKTGLTAGSHCADCGIVLVAQEVVEATGHNYVKGSCKDCKGCEAYNELTELFPYLKEMDEAIKNMLK